MHLPAQPLQEKEIYVSGSAELFPETRPEELMGRSSTIGLSGQVQYGFSDRFSLGVKGWVDAEGRESSIRSGYALSGQISTKRDSKSNLMTIYKVGMSLNGNDIAGYGVSGSVIYQRQVSSQFNWYAGSSLLWGFRYLELDTNPDGERALPMGFGVMAHLGIGWQLADALQLNVELVPIYQLNTFEKNDQFIVAPSIGIGYLLNQKQASGDKI